MRCHRVIDCSCLHPLLMWPFFFKRNILLSFHPLRVRVLLPQFHQPIRHDRVPGVSRQIPSQSGVLLHGHRPAPHGHHPHVLDLWFGERPPPGGRRRVQVRLAGRVGRTSARWEQVFPPTSKSCTNFNFLRWHHFDVSNLASHSIRFHRGSIISYTELIGPRHPQGKGPRPSP